MVEISARLLPRLGSILVDNCCMCLYVHKTVLLAGHQSLCNPGHLMTMLQQVLVHPETVIHSQYRHPKTDRRLIENDPGVRRRLSENPSINL